jgi:hypothetical protein
VAWYRSGADVQRLLPLPRELNAAFLRTVEEIVDEERWMQNGVAHYAEDAVFGRAFVFHVDHDGEDASIVVRNDGEVLMAAGPWGSKNGAALLGARSLWDWGDALYAPDDRAAAGVADDRQLAFEWG